MGEDQIFLARLQISSDELVQSSSDFYTYFTSVPNQLTSRRDKVSDLTTSINAVNQMVDSGVKCHLYVFTIRAKLYLSASKRRLISKKELLRSIVGDTSFSRSSRLKCIVGFAFAIAVTLKQAIFTA